MDAPKACSTAFGEPTLELLPPVGPLGFVTIAAERIPRHAEVTLAWDPGIGEVEVTTDADGQFRIPGLILPGDVWRRGPSSTGHRFADVEGAFPRRTGDSPAQGFRVAVLR